MYESEINIFAVFFIVYFNNDVKRTKKYKIIMVNIITILVAV